MQLQIHVALGSESFTTKYRWEIRNIHFPASASTRLHGRLLYSSRRCCPTLGWTVSVISNVLYGLYDGSSLTIRKAISGVANGEENYDAGKGGASIYRSSNNVIVFCPPREELVLDPVVKDQVGKSPGAIVDT